MNAAPRPRARSLDQRMIGGVIGGMARRFGWNCTWLRIGLNRPAWARRGRGRRCQVNYDLWQAMQHKQPPVKPLQAAPA